MSRHSTCRICKGQYHVCMNCGLTDYEEAPYDYGVCDKCFKTSGAREVWDAWYNAKTDKDIEVEKLLESFARNPFDPDYAERK